MKKNVIVAIPEGRHTGTIIDVVSRDTVSKGKSFTYIDFVVSVDGYGSIDGGNVAIKVGAPAHLSVDEKGVPKSNLAKLLSAIGVDLSSAEVDEKQAKGKRISYVTANVEVEGKGMFARIDEKSIKPAE